MAVEGGVGEARATDEAQQMPLHVLPRRQAIHRRDARTGAIQGPCRAIRTLQVHGEIGQGIKVGKRLYGGQTASRLPKQRTGSVRLAEGPVDDHISAPIQGHCALADLMLPVASLPDALAVAARFAGWQSARERSFDETPATRVSAWTNEKTFGHSISLALRCW